MKTLMMGASALALVAGLAGPAYAEFALTILHVNDFHARFEPITATDSNCGAADDAAGKCFAGIARLATAIAERKSAATGAGENVLLLNAGDNFQGSLYYTVYKSKVVSDLLNPLGFDLSNTGNHEFDDGPEEFAKFIDAATFPIIGGNFDVSAEPLLAGKINGVAVLTLAGERIAFIGALAEDTPETSSPGDNVVFESTIDYMRGAVAALEEGGINKIIALTHIGFTADKELAAAVPGIDLVVGGHSHTLLGDMAGAAGPYPTMVANPDGVDVPVVQAGQYGKYLGELKVVWDDEGKLVSAEGAPMLIDASVTPDADVVATLAALAGPLEEMKATVIGTAATSIDGSRGNCRARECEMGNLASDAILDRVKSQGVQIAVQNGGGLRASIDPGEITMGDALTVFPFSNTLATFKISGAGIKAALENGVSDIANAAGRFPQVAGLKYTFDTSKPVGERVSDVTVDMDGTWEPLDAAKTYGVVTNDYMRRGGDGYAMFATDAIDAYDFGPPLEQVLADYIAKLGGTYTAYLDGRITDASPAPAPAPEPAPAPAPAAPAPAAPVAPAPATPAPAPATPAPAAPAPAAPAPATPAPAAPAAAPMAPATPAAPAAPMSAPAAPAATPMAPATPAAPMAPMAPATPATPAP